MKHHYTPAHAAPLITRHSSSAAFTRSIATTHRAMPPDSHPVPRNGHISPRDPPPQKVGPGNLQKPGFSPPSENG
eukprot:9298367-Prorocentrum_lima.AAC.1